MCRPSNDMRQQGKPELRCQSSAGAVSTEMVIALPIFLFLIAAAIELGFMLYTATVIQDAARFGARRAVVLLDVPSQTTQIATATNSRMPGGYFFQNFAPTVSTHTVSGQMMVRVTISGPYNFWFFKLLGISSVNLSRFSQQRYERQTLDGGT